MRVQEVHVKPAVGFVDLIHPCEYPSNTVCEGGIEKNVVEIRLLPGCMRIVTCLCRELHANLVRCACMVNNCELHGEAQHTFKFLLSRIRQIQE